MTIPTVTELLAPLEPTVRDTFADEPVSRSAGAKRAASWPWSTRRPADA